MEQVQITSDIRLVPVAELLPYARNSKRHTDAQIRSLADTIKRVGWTNPCLVADGTILAGHGRVQAAKVLGLERVPCIDLSHLPEAERRALVIYDNQSGSMHGAAGYDLEMLMAETSWLRDEGYDVEAMTGFGDTELVDLLAEIGDGLDGGGGGGGGGGNGDPEAVPDVPAEPVSRLGDVWEFRDADGVVVHAVACGSCTEAGIWDALMGGGQADLVVTDPPYGVDVGEKMRRISSPTGVNRTARKIQGDDLKDGPLYELWLGAFRQYLRVARAGAPIYCYFSWTRVDSCLSAIFDSGVRFQSILIWRKNHFVLARTDYQQITEPLVYGWVPGGAHSWYGGRKNTNIVEIGDGGPFVDQDGRLVVAHGDDVYVVPAGAVVEKIPSDFVSVPRPMRSELHPTTKPVELLSRHIRNSARRGDMVVDGFGGSGSTMIAAHSEGCRSRLIELTPGYTDVICRRMWNFSGIRPVHAVTGEPFPAEGEVRGEVAGMAEAVAGGLF